MIQQCNNCEHYVMGICTIKEKPRDYDDLCASWTVDPRFSSVRLKSHDEILRIATNMETTGGSFVKALGSALRRADSTNTFKIQKTWPEYIKQYDY